MEPVNQDLQDTSPVVTTGKTQHESYFQLVWSRFKKSKPAIAGGLMVVMLLVLAILPISFLPPIPVTSIWKTVLCRRNASTL